MLRDFVSDEIEVIFKLGIYFFFISSPKAFLMWDEQPKKGNVGKMKYFKGGE